MKVNIRRPTEEESETLPFYDNTRMTAISTCPRWGSIRYGSNLRMSGSARAMALEAGGACHKAFAAHALWNVLADQKLDEHAIVTGLRVFGEDNLRVMLDQINAKEDDITNKRDFCLSALYTSGFYDDPSDKRRTMSNLEEAVVTYVMRSKFHTDVWIQDKSDPKSLVGIEWPFKLVIEIHSEVFKSKVEPWRLGFNGMIDGVNVMNDGSLGIVEHKTASRLNEAWEMSFNTSHQVTGYCVAAATITGQDINRGVARGLALPVPRSALDALAYVPFKREEWQIQEWLNWFLNCANMYEQYGNEPHLAPTFTHSCNRYFRPCSFIPLCSVSPEERLDMLQMMEEDVWNPTEDSIE